MPANEIRVRNNDIDCEDARTKQNFECEVIDSDQDHFTIKVDNLCRYNFCTAGEQIAWHLYLSNSNSLIFEEE